MIRYLVLYQPTESGYTAWVPDLPGCVTTGATRPEAETHIREAVDFHVAGLLHEGQPLPQPRTEHGHVVVGR